MCDKPINTNLDKALYEQYAKWHIKKGYWVNETPNGDLI